MGLKEFFVKNEKKVDNSTEEKLSNKENMAENKKNIVENIAENEKNTDSFWSKGFKKIKRMPLYIFLIEDTGEMVKHNDKVLALYEAIPKESLVCFIHYGSLLFNSGICLNNSIRKR